MPKQILRMEVWQEKTKCLADPWIFRYQDQTWGVLAIRAKPGEISRTIEKSDILWFYQWKQHRQNMFWTSFLKRFRIERSGGRPADMMRRKRFYPAGMGSGGRKVSAARLQISQKIKNVRKEARRISDGREEFQGNIQDAVVSNIMEITETEEQYLRALLETPVLQRIEIKNRRLSTKSVLEGKEMPEAEGI